MPSMRKRTTSRSRSGSTWHVARAVVDGLGQHEVHEAHDRRVLDLLAQSGEVDVLVAFGARREIELLEDLADALLGADLLIELVDRFAHFAGLAIETRMALQPVNALRWSIDTTSSGSPMAISSAPSFLAEREHARLPRQVLGDQLDHLGIGEREPRRPGDREAELLGQQLDHVAFLENAEPHQRLPEALARIVLGTEREVDLVRRGLAVLEHELAESARGQPVGERHARALVASGIGATR
jgi:hypothetical protein